MEGTAPHLIVVGWMVAVGRVGSKYFAQVKGGTTDMYRMYSPAYTRNRSLEERAPFILRTYFEDQSRLPGHNEPSERSRYLAGIGEGKEDNPNQDLVRERIKKAAQAGGLARKPGSVLVKQIFTCSPWNENGHTVAMFYLLAMAPSAKSVAPA